MPILRSSRDLARLALVLAFGCVQVSCGAVIPQIGQPASHTAATPNSASGVLFLGTYPYAQGRSIDIQVLDPSGVWTTLATAPVSTRGFWAVNVAIPAAAYFQPCGAAVFRALPNDGKPQLPAWDQPCLSAGGTPGSGSLCLKDLVVLTQPGSYPSTYAGDLEVEGVKQAERFACIADLQGSLTLDDATPASVEQTWLTNAQYVAAETKLSLPALAHVSGDLNVTLSRFGELSATGSGAGAYVIASADLPLLTQVDGNIDLHAVNNSNASPAGAAYHWGLNAITSVGANVTIDNSVYFNHYDALTSLAEIPGDLTINWVPDSDFIEASLLPKLVHVHGNLRVTAGLNMQTLLPSLKQVDGDVTLNAPGYAGPPYEIIPNLTQVGGSLTITGGFRLDCAKVTFPSLASIGGRLNLNGGTPRGQIGNSGLQLGGLVIDSTAITMLPLPPMLGVANSGTVAIQNNAKLCQCQVDGFILTLQAAGWNGTPSAASNGSAVSCVPCPTPVCQ